MKLSPKAQQFIRRAVAELTSGPLRSAVRRLGANPWCGELSPEAEDVALAALDRCTEQIRARLETRPAEDETADLSNDLGFIDAVRSDLERSRKRAAPIR
jgi:hypothetical protein